MEKATKETLDRIAMIMRRKGYDPLEQLEGFVQTGMNHYITRTDGARDMIGKISVDDIREYLKEKKI